MDRLEIEATAARATYLRGLTVVPLGLFFLLQLGLFGLLGVVDQRPGQAWQGALVVLLVVLELVTRRYYRTRFGAARRRRLTSRHAAAYLVLPVLFTGGFLLDTRLHSDLAATPDWSTHLSATTLGFAVGTLLWYRLHVGPQAHHAWLWGSLAVLGLMPVWGWAFGHSMVALGQGFMLIGAALVLGGVLDHRLLVATLPEATSDEASKAALVS